MQTNHQALLYSPLCIHMSHVTSSVPSPGGTGPNSPVSTGTPKGLSKPKTLPSASLLPSLLIVARLLGCGLNELHCRWTRAGEERKQLHELGGAWIGYRLRRVVRM